MRSRSTLGLVAALMLALGCGEPTAGNGGLSLSTGTTSAGPGPHEELYQILQRRHAEGIPADADRRPTLRNLEMLGHLPLSGDNADVWAHEGFAYVGTSLWGGPPDYPYCPAAGVRVVDITDPANPTLVGAVGQVQGTTQEDVAVARITTPAFHGDLLVTGTQACRADGPVGGIDIWDVTNPRAPQHLAYWPIHGASPSGDLGTEHASARGVHELYLFQRGSRAFVAAAVPFAEDNPAHGGGDFRLVEVTDPRNPVQVGEWGAFTDGGFQREPGLHAYGHSAMVDETGTRAVVSYMDLGNIILDIADPAKPTFVGRTVYPASDEGNAHSSWFAPGGNLLLTADEDFDGTDGWGFLRLWDVQNGANPVEIGRFLTENAQRPPQNWWECCYTVHNPVVRGATAYLSWYSDGVRVVDISQPSAPREVASFVPHPWTYVWGVHAERELIVASDVFEGLYVMKRTP